MKTSPSGHEHTAELPSPSTASYKNAATRSVSVRGEDFAYRALGPEDGVPLILLVHLAGVLDNWDPRVVDGLAARRRVIAFDNRAVGASSGSTPGTIEEMARDAVLFIRGEAARCRSNSPGPALSCETRAHCCSAGTS